MLCTPVLGGVLDEVPEAVLDCPDVLDCPAVLASADAEGFAVAVAPVVFDAEEVGVTEAPPAIPRLYSPSCVTASVIVFVSFE